jgi:hypothetical protein
MQTVKPKERNGSERNGGIRIGYERKCEVRRRTGTGDGEGRVVEWVEEEEEEEEERRNGRGKR